jgi:hypothetical protein
MLHLTPKCNGSKTSLKKNKRILRILCISSLKINRGQTDIKEESLLTNIKKITWPKCHIKKELKRWKKIKRKLNILNIKKSSII